MKYQLKNNQWPCVTNTPNPESKDGNWQIENNSWRSIYCEDKKTVVIFKLPNPGVIGDVIKIASDVNPWRIELNDDEEIIYTNIDGDASKGLISYDPGSSIELICIAPTKWAVNSSIGKIDVLDIPE